MDLSDELQRVLSASNMAAEELDALIASSIAAFETMTGRYLGPPADGDPLETKTFAVNGSVAKIKDARVVTTIEVSSTRLNPTWTAAPAGADVDTCFNDDTFVYLTLPIDSSAVAVRVTGKFGLLGLDTPPLDVEHAIVTLAAHIYRSEGSEGDGKWEIPDGQDGQSFTRLPLLVYKTVTKWTVADPAGLRIPFV